MTARPWGQPSKKAATRGVDVESCGVAEVFDCGCRYAISEGWAPCATHAAAEDMRALLAHVPHDRRAALHRMVSSVAGCPGCTAEALLARIGGAHVQSRQRL